MGVKTALAGITFTTGGKNQGVAVGVDMAGTLASMQLKCQELITQLNFLVADVLTPAGSESSNISTINTQITALS